MKEYLISQFIDDEMDIDDKIDFIETVHESYGFKTETLEFLEQEKLLQAPMVTCLPPDKRIIPAPPKRPFFSLFLPPLGGFATAILLVAAIFWFRPLPQHQVSHRFVIYRPAAAQAEIIGSFTNWQPAAMEKMGDTGYWTLTLSLPEGEHRYSYLVENGRQVADPTILIREKDDFGGENSIIRIGGQA